MATTLRSLLLTATGSITVLGAVLTIRAVPAGQADAPPASAPPPAVITGGGTSLPPQAPLLPGAPARPGAPAPPETLEPPGTASRFGAPVLPEAPILPGAAQAPEIPAPPGAPARPAYPPYDPSAGMPWWERYFGRTPSSSSTATRMNPETMITQIHLARAWKGPSLISDRGV
ncbi:hypothetical protein ACFQVD_21995 [Streptosporangium amethystogenes subsp. fukuiense]|uniref:Uncharacterized protein n=1 Tax=Streptosporangium amethystogenes subsp. fukuiense TaxID=698418 RepID=A0ABW2T359_9ACTN